MANDAERRIRFGEDPTGAPVEAATLRSGGATARVMTWGATLLDYRIADVDHALVLGAPSLAPYFSAMRYFGATVGRVANRIANGHAMIDGAAHAFDRNENDRSTLHGGAQGCSDRNWRLEDCDAAACRMTLRLPDGLGGFPGDLDIAATYALDDAGALDILYEATTNAPTLCNLAHHSYWNLDGSSDASAHRLTVFAERYLPVDVTQIPVGPSATVAETRFDFRRARPVTRPGDGPLDHNFCLADAPTPALRPACVLESASGVRLQVSTTEPGLQIYDAGGLDTGSTPGHGGAPYGARAGVAIEPQRWPDAPNQPGYPSILLRPNERYRQASRFAATAPTR